MNRTQKAAFVEDLTARLNGAGLVVLADFRGASVAQTNDLRREFEKTGLKVQVVKNTLAKRVIAGTEMEGLGEHFQGMTGVIIGGEDGIAAAKVIKSSLFAKGSPMAVKAGFFDGVVLDPNGVKAVADLPSREELLSLLLRTLQEGPRQIMGVIRAPARDLLYLLKNYESKLAEAEGDE